MLKKSFQDGGGIFWREGFYGRGGSRRVNAGAWGEIGW